MNKNTLYKSGSFVAFLLLFLLLNLHLVRNISLVGYMAGVVLLYFVVFASGKIPYIDLAHLGSVSTWILLFFSTGLWAAAMTFWYYGLSAGAYATSRYFLTVPLVVASYNIMRTNNAMRTIMISYVVFVTLAAMTSPLQYLIGPISWFADPSERANMTRYGSLFGSLTSAGIVIPMGYYLTLVLRIRPTLKLILVLCLVFTSLFTLQKAVLVGMLLATLLYLMWIDFRTLLKMLAFTGLGSLIWRIVDSLLVEWLPWKSANDYAMAILFLSDNTSLLGGDVTLIQSIIDRFTILPSASLKELVEFQGYFGYLLGGGFGMVGEALMRPGDSSFITAHNGYVDLLLIGGVFHLVAFIGLLMSCLIFALNSLRYAGSTETELPIAIIGISFIIIIGSLFGGAVNYQPNSSSLLWTIVGFIWRCQIIQHWKIQTVNGKNVAHVSLSKGTRFEYPRIGKRSV